MEFAELVEKLKGMNLTLKDFSELSRVPLATIKGWGYPRNDKKRCVVPAWVKPFLSAHKDRVELRITIRRLLEAKEEGFDVRWKG